MAGKDMAGQKGRPKKGGKFVNIFIWDANTCEQIGAPISGVIQSAVRQLKFSKDGKSIFGIGDDDNHKLAAYEVEETVNKKVNMRKMLGSCSTDQEKILDAKWNNLGTKIAMVSIKNKLEVEVGTAVFKAKKIQTQDRKIQYSVCEYDASDNLVVGTADGNIYFKGTTPTKAHEGCVNILRMIEGTLYSAGADGLVL